MDVNILAVGDVCSQSGLDFLKRNLRALRRQYGVGFCVVNGENANGVGITPKQADAIFEAGADVVTLGNHTWSRYEIKPYLEEHTDILRPENFSPQCPGRGWDVYETDFGPVCVISLAGRFAMDVNVDNPFLTADYVLSRLEKHMKIVLVDMHAEATSERVAMGYYLDGRASAVWGTHTHVQTSDAFVLPGGTAFQTDLGMTGPWFSSIGREFGPVRQKFLTGVPSRFTVAEGPATLEGAVISFDPTTKKASAIEAYRYREPLA